MSVYRRRVTGIVTIVVLCALVVLAIVRPSNPFADRPTYFALFDTAHGLGPIDRDVRVAGVRVGKIGAVKRIGDDVRVELVLERPTTLHRDARAAMRPHTLFEGSNYIDLEPGSPSAAVMPEGATIPRAQTRNYVTLDQALRVLRPDIRRGLQRLARTGSRTLRGEGVDGIQQTLSSAPALVSALAPAARAAQGTHRRELAGAVAGLSRTVDALERRSGDIGPLIERTHQTAAAVTVDDTEPLDATLVALPGTLRELRTSGPAVTGLVTRAGRLADELTPGLPALAGALHAGVPVLRRAVPVTEQAAPLVRNGRLIAARLADSRAALVEMFELTEPSLDKFESLFEVFNTPTDLGAPTGVSQLVGGGFTGLNAVFRPYKTAQQSATAPGHQGRVGVYVNPTGLLGLVDQLGTGGTGTPLLRNEQPPCRRVAAISRRVARQLSGIGACQ